MKSIPSVRSISLRVAAPVVVGTLALGGAAAAIASSSSSGPAEVPPAKPLAEAIHDTLAAPTPDGLTASFSLRNRLIQGGPLPSAEGTLRISGDGRLRADVTAGDRHWQLGFGDRRLTAYDVEGKTVYTGTVPVEIDGALRMLRALKPSPALIEMALKSATELFSVSGAKPTNVAGRPAYQLRVAPAHDGGLLGAAEIAWDPATGLPLRAAVYAHGETEPVLEAKATDVRLGPVAPDAVRVDPPKDARVVRIDSLPSGSHRLPAIPGLANGGGKDTDKGGNARDHAGGLLDKLGSGAGRGGIGIVGGDGDRPSSLADVRQAVDFELLAPAELAGLPRKDVREVELGGRSGAIVTYGEGLGALIVAQIPSEVAELGGPWKLGRNPRLPEISVDGTTGHELATALGTLLSFERDGVAYTLVGSVPAVAAETAARDLDGK
jgi:hypothetical protein